MVSEAMLMENIAAVLVFMYVQNEKKKRNHLCGGVHVCLCEGGDCIFTPGHWELLKGANLLLKNLLTWKVTLRLK